MKSTSRNRRKDPKQGMPGDKTEHLLIEGLEELLNDGASFSEITVAGITKSAGVTRSAFYFYFPNKSMALIAAIEHVRHMMVETCDPVFIDYSTDFFSVVAEVLGEITQLWGEHCALFTAMIDGAASDPELGVIWSDWMLSFYEGIVKRARHELSKVDVEYNDVLLENVITRLLWTNERNFYYFFKSGTNTEQDSNAFKESLALVWTSSLKSLFG